MTAVAEYLVKSLTALALAREYEASHPTVATPKVRVTCPTCGSDNAHRLWVSLTARCESEWHNDK